jgi:2-succinyl-6-hydroxy-2,4-cyclohexadiene-1-carboxylate synthase
VPVRQVGDVEYAYHCCGSGPAALLLHGFTGMGEAWSGLAAALGSRFRVITVDLLGHGRSSAPEDPGRYRIERAAEDLAELLGGWVDGPAHLLGYSMGGRLALYFTLAFPQLVRSLVLESASPGLETAEERGRRVAVDEALAARIEQDGVEAFVAEWERLPLFASQLLLPEDTRQELRVRRLQNRAAGLAGSLRGMGAGSQPSLWSRLAEVRPRTLLVAGELDEKYCALNRRMVQALPGARLEVIPRAGHTVHLEQPERYVEIVKQFWSEESSR